MIRSEQHLSDSKIMKILFFKVQSINGRSAECLKKFSIDKRDLISAEPGEFKIETLTSDRKYTTVLDQIYKFNNG